MQGRGDTDSCLAVGRDAGQLTEAPALGDSGWEPRGGGMPAMSPAQRTPHSNPQYRGAIFRDNKSAHTFLQGQGEEGAGSQCRGNGWTPLLPALVLSSGSAPRGLGGSVTLAT